MKEIDGVEHNVDELGIFMYNLLLWINEKIALIILKTQWLIQVIFIWKDKKWANLP